MDCFNINIIGTAVALPTQETFRHITGSDVAEFIAFSITWQFSENADATEARISGKGRASMGC